MSEINGVIGINKPQNFTSFDVVAKLRGMLKIKKIGHAGTLDPIATGVLPILLGKATKLCNIILDEYKEYEARFKLGISTDTYDVTGKVLNKINANITKFELQMVLKKYLGDIIQIVPMYSAVKINGKKLYEIARDGKEIERPKRKITIYKLELLNYNQNICEVTILVGCSKGTYIRSLIYDVGNELKCGAVLIALVRTKSCSIKLSECFTFEQIEKIIKNKEIQKILIKPDKFFQKFISIILSENDTIKFLNGAKFSAEKYALNKSVGFIKIYNNNNEFLGLGKLEKDNCEIKIYKILI